MIWYIITFIIGFLCGGMILGMWAYILGRSDEYKDKYNLK